MNAVAMTAAERILTIAAGVERVEPGEYVVARPDLVVLIDAIPWSILDWFDENELTVFDRDRVAVVFDHMLRDRSGERMRRFCTRHQLRHVFDIGRHGLSHQIPAEAGLALPGTLYHNFDTMASTMGGIGALALAGTSDTEAVLALGEMWIRVPESVEVELRGAFAAGVTTRDLFAVVRRDVGPAAASRVLHFTGPGVRKLSIDSRMGLCNGAGVMGAATALVEPDEVVATYVAERTSAPFECIVSDPGATFASRSTIDLGTVGPMLSAPPSPEDVIDLADVAGTPVQQAYLGSCGSGRLEDLQLAASILRGRQIAPGVRMIVTPISTEVMRTATETGVIETLVSSGATVTTPGCGACWIGNQSPGELAEGEVCISTSTENSMGRMGSPGASIYLGSAASVAASALEGQIADPRPYLTGDRPRVG